jgi:hypothetical protein
VGHAHPAKFIRQPAAGDNEAAAEKRAEADGQRQGFQEISRLLFIAGTTLITDWANSQKVRTLNTMPASRRSVPTNWVSLIQCS